MFEPAEAALDVAQRDSGRGQHAAIVLGPLMNDFALSFPTEAGDVSDVHGVAPCFIAQICHDGFGWLEHYQKELGALTFPPDSAEGSPFPFYDRWGDSFNLSQEFVILNQGHGFATWAWVFAQTSLAKQPWKPALLQITKESAAGAKPANLRLTLTGADAKDARILWEADGAEPAFGAEFVLPAVQPSWAEVEAQLPDGRLAFSVTNFTTARGTTRTAQRK